MLDFIISQFTPLPPATASFEGQTLIVTGANTGLGLETARHFVRLGAEKVILAVRTLSKGEEAAKAIEQSTGRQDVTEVWQLDMSNFQSVQEFARRAQGLDRVDAIVENAGVARSNFSLEEGFESTVTVNVVSTFLLALNMMPILRKSAKKTGNVPRLVIVSSEVHAWVSVLHRIEIVDL